MWRGRTDLEINDIMKEENIINFVTEQIIKLIGCIVRIDKWRHTKRLSERVPVICLVIYVQSDIAEPKTREKDDV